MELEEVRAALARFKAYNETDAACDMSYFTRDQQTGVSQAERDNETLACAFVDEMDRRDQEAAERAMPIDEEWLRSLGQVIRDDRYAIAVRTESMTVVHAKNATKHATAIRFEDAIENVCAVEAKTRGEVIDLRNGLKGNSTQCTC